MRSLLVLIASAFTASWADNNPPIGSELFNGREDYGSSKDGFTCTASNLRKALNKANYEFNGDCDTACGPCNSPTRRLDSDSDTDWDAINNGECANYPIEVLCSVSVWTSHDPFLFSVEYREEVLCCWQLGFPPESFNFVRRPARPDGQNRHLVEDGPDVKKAEKLAYKMVKSDFSESKVPQRSLKAASLEHKRPPLDFAILRHGIPKTPELVASMRALAASLKGEEVERRLDEDSSTDTDEMTEDSDSPMDRLAVPDGYNCNNYWQVRADLLTAYDQSPWRIHSYCGAGNERFSINVVSSTSSSFNHGEPTQCRDMPVYTPLTYAVPPSSDDHSGGLSLCSDGLVFRRDFTWAVSYLSYGPLQCCLEFGIFPPATPAP